MKDKKDRKRLTLDKKVLKHLVVKSNVKTGASAYCDGGGGFSSISTTGPTRSCNIWNHNATRVRRRG